MMNAGSLTQKPEVFKQNCEPFLSDLAQAPKTSWHQTAQEIAQKHAGIIKNFSLKEALNSLKPLIMQSDDLDLITLFHRAVNNHNALNTEKTAPVPFYYKHYQAPRFLISHINLTLDVKPSGVGVTADLMIKRNSSDTSLILNGKDLNLISVRMEDTELSSDEYIVTTNELIILNIPDKEEFTLSVATEIDPANNHSLEGMYVSGNGLVTQCETEGASRIFYTINRPDVLSTFGITIIADDTQYPCRLSNGNKIHESISKEGWGMTKWSVPYPMPCYLFACVLGNYGKVEEKFKTKEGKAIDLEIYVEHGKEPKAAYAMEILKLALQFDEEFDRCYYFSNLKFAALPICTHNAMENSGLVIFNEKSLLLDPDSAADENYRWVARIIAHELLQHWTGNRVTIRNWFEIALKEAFTEFRSALFVEKLFGKEFIRPKDVTNLRETQFPLEFYPSGHPLIVESYEEMYSIYNPTTYFKGCEVFRALYTYVETYVKDGFRDALSKYLEVYDGKAVTYMELLDAFDKVLPKESDTHQFKEWFKQQGTPQVTVRLDYNADDNLAAMTIEQSCPHPFTGQLQPPLPIPFSFELLSKSGEILCEKQNLILTEPQRLTTIRVQKKPVPVFMHDFSAPVTLNYNYSRDELSCIIKYADDPFSRWEACRNYTLKVFKEFSETVNVWNTLDLVFQPGQIIISGHLELYKWVLINNKFSPLVKAQIVEIPSVRALSQACGSYDFAALAAMRSLFTQQLALFCKPTLERMLEEYPEPEKYLPKKEDMEIRELRNASLYLLARIDPSWANIVYDRYQNTDNFNNFISAFNILLNIESPKKEVVTLDFYNKSKNDPTAFTHWLSIKASASSCRVDDLRAIEQMPGFEFHNPAHIRSLFQTFTLNLGCYHDHLGEGYKYIVDKFLQIKATNPILVQILEMSAFIDLKNLPEPQRTMLAKEMARLT